MSNIVVKARCFPCDHIEDFISIKKPRPFSPGTFEIHCVKCGSYNSYRASIKGSEIKLETVWVRASEKGVKKYEERTGKTYPSAT